MAEIQRVARREGTTVGEWVRKVLHQARAERPLKDKETRLKAVRRAVACNHPTADIDQMLRETEQGYQS